MAKLFDWKKRDDYFVESMFVSVKRKAMIKQLESTRKLYLGLMIFVLMFGVILFFLGAKTISNSLFAFGMMVVFYTYTDTQIKMLKTFEKMESLPKANNEQ